jgi:hypothetical protein
MHSLRLSRAGRVGLYMALSSLFCTTHAGAAGGQAKPAATVAGMEEWRKAAADASPKVAGCFTADYPSQVWQKVDCGPPPSDPPMTLSPDQSETTIRSDLGPLKGDYTMVPTNKITSATGRLQTLYNVTTVIGINSRDGSVLANTYSLQLNSNQGLPGKSGNQSCSTSTNRACSGWIQFVYNSQRYLYIQYWFLDYLSNATQKCPSQIPLSSGLHCAANAVFTILPSAAPNQFTSMQGATLQAKAQSNGMVTVIYTAGGHSYSATGVDRVGTFGNWTDAEFNVFGRGVNKVSTFTAVNFNAGSEITIGLTSDNDSSGKDPVCHQGSTTKENNNLFLGPCNATAVPGIWFNEGQPTPQVNSITPSAGSDAGGTSVVLNGGPFDQAVQVMFGTKIAGVSSCGGSTCTVTSPALGSRVNPVPVTAAYIFQNGTPGPFSTNAPGDLFSYVDVPKCSFSDYCPYYQNQPPNYDVTCGSTSNFYSWSGTAVSPVEPPVGSLNLLASNATSYVGVASSEPVFVAACVPGTENHCTSFSTQTANWCYTHGQPPPPPPPPPTCAACGGGRKCCPNPYGGKGQVCVAQGAPCPPLQ